MKTASDHSVVCTTDSGRILECGHEICFGGFLFRLSRIVLLTSVIDCVLELKNQPLTATGEVYVLFTAYMRLTHLLQWAWRRR
jgi:hypothetical protein